MASRCAERPLDEPLCAWDAPVSLDVSVSEWKSARRRPVPWTHAARLHAARSANRKRAAQAGGTRPTQPDRVERTFTLQQSMAPEQSQPDRDEVSFHVILSARFSRLCLPVLLAQ